MNKIKKWIRSQKLYAWFYHNFIETPEQMLSREFQEELEENSRANK